MNAVWSVQNNSNGKVSLTKAELATLSVSVSQWKKNNPEDVTILYCDKDWLNYFYFIGLIRLWDKVDSDFLEKNKHDSSISKNVFWAASKIQILKEVEAPVVHIDNDFFAIKKLSDYGLFEGDIAVAYKEDTKDFYIEPKIATIGAEIEHIKDFKGIAYNTSILYFKDETVKNKYCDISLKYMQDASLTYDKKLFNQNGSLYMIFAEQQLLGEFSEVNNLDIKTLIQQVFLPKTGNYVTNENNKGLFDIDEMDAVAGHLGEVKKDFRENVQLSETFALNLMNKINSL